LLLALTQPAHVGWHAADVFTDLGEEFGLCARAERVQVLAAALEAVAGTRIKGHHVAVAFQPPQCCSRWQQPLLKRVCQHLT
jgi:hypothetical protein